MEYENIYQASQKMGQYINIDRELTEEEDNKKWESIETLRGLLANWERAYNTKQQRGLIKNMNQREQADKKIYTDIQWITINPDYLNIKYEDFIKRTHQFMHRSCMKGIYCFEQGGEVEGDYKHIHVHALIQKTPNLKRDLNSQFKKYVSDQYKIKIMPCTEQDIENRKIYMSGVKKDPLKNAKAANNILFRKHYSLEAIYTC